MLNAGLSHETKYFLNIVFYIYSDNRFDSFFQHWMKACITVFRVSVERKSHFFEINNVLNRRHRSVVFISGGHHQRQHQDSLQYWLEEIMRHSGMTGMSENVLRHNNSDKSAWIEEKWTLEKKGD